MNSEAANRIGFYGAKPVLYKARVEALLRCIACAEIEGAVTADEAKELEAFVRAGQ